MEYFLFILKTSLDDFRKNKIRTFLTSLGILIGVSSVILLIAFGLGLKRYIQQQFDSLGTNLIYIIPGNLQSGGFAGGALSGIRFDDRDVSTLKRIRGIMRVLPVYAKFTRVASDTTSGTYEIAATTVDVFPVMNLEIQYGKPFDKTDTDRGAKKVVLGPKIAAKLFGTETAALNKTVKIENQGYKVVGITKSKGGGGLGTPSVDDHIYMPFKAAYSFNPDKKYYAIYVQARSGEELSTAKDSAKKELGKRYKADDFSVLEQTEFLNTINAIFNILNAVLISIAAISLVVGGVGIMNIMYVAVTERIKEIGIRRAVGATTNDILFQFLAESVILSSLGGLLGLGISSLIVLLVQPLFPAYIDLPSVVIAIGVSSVIGVIFGVLPAKKAADLSPIEAIRYE